MVPTGPIGHPMDSSYKCREDPEYKEDFGNAMVNFARVIPDGILVFFPSYIVMQSCLDHWRRGRHGKTVDSIPHSVVGLTPMLELDIVQFCWLHAQCTQLHGGFLLNKPKTKILPRRVTNLGIDSSRCISYVILPFSLISKEIWLLNTHWPSGKPSITERIMEHKHVVVEPKEASLFQNAINDFKRKVHCRSANGCVFFSVCRGKVIPDLYRMSFICFQIY